MEVLVICAKLVSNYFNSLVILICYNFPIESVEVVINKNFIGLEFASYRFRFLILIAPSSLVYFYIRFIVI